MQDVADLNTADSTMTLQDRESGVQITFGKWGGGGEQTGYYLKNSHS